MALIERDVLIKRFCGHCIDYGKCIEKCFDVEIIESIPPVDAVPVEFIRGERKNSTGVYSISMRILLDTWEERKEDDKVD